MAAVDSLLRIAVERRADGLIIVAGKVPELRRGEDQLPLTMPPLAPAMVDIFVREVCRDGDAIGSFEYANDAGSYRVVVDRRAGAKALEFHRVKAAAADRGDEPAAVDSVVQSQVASEPAAAVEAESSPLSGLLARAERARVSDLLLSEGGAARVRMDGALRVLEDSHVGPAVLDALLRQAGPDAAAKLELSGSVDFAIDRRAVGGLRHRVNVFRHAGGRAAAIRPIQRRIPDLAGLGLPPSLARLTELTNGLVIIAGVAGSGKSTTASALIEHLNRTRAVHVVTLEDPAEYAFQSRRALIHQRELGTHVASFSAGLAAAVRESPDVIFVGEMRDAETMSAAITAAETGHLVLTTLHSRGASWAVERILDAISADQRHGLRAQLALVLRGVLVQHLLPSSQGGRVVAHELLIGTPAVAQLIRDGNSHQLPSAISTGAESGMMALERSLAHLVREGHVEMARAAALASDPELLRRLVAR